MEEIGGYFGLDELSSNEYYPDLIAVNTARNALVYICRAKKIRKLYIPYYLCDSVSAVCKREGFTFEYYHVNPDFTPDFGKRLENGEYLYVVNYFGQLSDEYISALKKQYVNLIIDNVQAFFRQPVKGIDTIYSCRKFFGVPDGAYLSTDKPLDEPLETDMSNDRMKHILGRYEETASAHYSEFKDNDESFFGIPLMYMSRLTHNLLGALNYGIIIERREKNFEFLDGALGEANKFSLKKPVGPFMYPFYCKDGTKIRKILADKKIYIPTLWPNVSACDECELEKDYAENILPLPCDHRYGKSEMQRIVDCVNEGVGKLNGQTDDIRQHKINLRDCP